MAAVVESVATQTYIAPTGGGGDDLVITKPTGLAVGDTMIACLGHHGDNSNANQLWNTPSGWTEVFDRLLELTSTDGVSASMFFKVADASDVSASDFTFSVIAGQEKVGGCIMRVSGLVASPFGASGYEQKNDTDNPAYSIGLTPPTNILYVAMVLSGSAPFDTTNIVLNGTNPTWTQRLDISTSVDVSSRLEVFTAPDATPGTITTMTPTETESTAGTDSIGFLAYFLEKIDQSGTHTLHVADADFFGVTGSSGVMASNALHSADADFFNTSGRATTPTQWANETKPSTTWVNDTL